MLEEACQQVPGSRMPCSRRSAWYWRRCCPRCGGRRTARRCDGRSGPRQRWRRRTSGGVGKDVVDGEGVNGSVSDGVGDGIGECIGCGVHAGTEPVISSDPHVGDRVGDGVGDDVGATVGGLCASMSLHRLRSFIQDRAIPPAVEVELHPGSGIPAIGIRRRFLGVPPPEYKDARSDL